MTEGKRREFSALQNNNPWLSFIDNIVLENNP
jgi:hypothetical protein